MSHRMIVRSGITFVFALVTVVSAGWAWALTPILVWQASGYPGPFSSDGSAVYMSTSTGFQMRRATDGLVLKTITLPAASQAYDKAAFSPDKQFVAISLVDTNGVVKIEIYSLSTGALVRTITTDAVRNIRGLDLSSNSSLIASMERFAYGGGGKLRIFRTSDGSVVRETGPYVVNSNTFVKFSPGGTYLALYQNNGNPAGFNILRTSDWGTAQTIALGNQYMIQWAGTDTSASVWLRGNFVLGYPYQQVTVPGGSVVKSLMFDDSTYRSVTAVTSNNKYLLTWQVQTTDPGSPQANTIWFFRTSDGGAQVTYTFSTTIVSSGTINPAGTQFTYAICGSDGACTTYVAQMPLLP
jgi:WD40 repeat protein